MSIPFRPPEWASQPKQSASLADDGGNPPTRVDEKPFYLLGRDADHCDIPLQHSSASRVHAALVHHTDGRIFLIDLKSAHGTRVNGVPLEVHKPFELKNGAVITFGSVPQSYTLALAPPVGKPGQGPAKGGSRPHTGTVRASHLLVKHRDSRRPSSWKEPTVTRSKEEALEMIQAFRARIMSGEVTLADLARTESHCSSARNGGDLGEFGPGQMQAAFEDATYVLEVGELSGPVFSDSGVHLIQRTQ